MKCDCQLRDRERAILWAIAQQDLSLPEQHLHIRTPFQPLHPPTYAAAEASG